MQVASLKPGHKIVKIVEWKNVEELTRLGWVLVTTHNATPGSGYYPIFQLEMDFELVELEASRINLTKELEAQVRTLNRQVGDQTAMAKGAVTDRDIYKATAEKERTLKVEYQTAARRMEQDIAKIREHIGAAKMKEILEG